MFVVAEFSTLLGGLHLLVVESSTIVGGLGLDFLFVEESSTKDFDFFFGVIAFTELGGLLVVDRV